MATRRYKLSPGETEFQVVEEIGGANNSDVVELTVDLDNTKVTTSSGTRAVEKEEVLLALDMMKNHILKGNWPPA